MPDWLAQSGVVLFTERFEACVAFYRGTLGLEVLADYGKVVLLQFGGAYLMIEEGGVAAAEGKSRAASPVTLRFNTADVAGAAGLLRTRGVAVEVASFEWGTIGSFLDPDGNRCELRNHSAEFTRPASA